MQEEFPGTQELEERLEAYASTRLSPRRKEIARMRVSLVEEARMRQLQATLSSGALAGRRRRLATSLFLAAAVALGGAVGVAATSVAGGPLYGARIWLETATLPADPAQRALERLHLIDARVVDLEQAAASGNASAVAAATAAYRESVQAAFNEAGSDSMHLTDLKSDLGIHVTVLETLAERVPAKALDGINNAIDASNKAVQRIDDTKKGNGQGTGSGGGSKSPEVTPAP